MNVVSDILKCFSKLFIIYPPNRRKQSKWRYRGCKLFYIGIPLFVCIFIMISTPRYLNSFLTTQCQTEVMAMGGFVITVESVIWTAYCLYSLYGKENITKMLRKFDDIHYRIKHELDVNITLRHHQKITNGLVFSICAISIISESVVFIQQYSSHFDSFLDLLLFACLSYVNFFMLLWLMLMVLLECTLINLICIELVCLNSVKNPWSLNFRRIYLGIYYDVGSIVADVFGLIVLSFLYFCFGSAVLTISAQYNPQSSCIIKENPMVFIVLLYSLLLSTMEFGEYAGRKVGILF